MDQANESFSVLTATPDLVAQGLIQTLVDKLAEWSVRVVAAMPQAFSAPAAAELYEGRVTHQRSESRLHSTWLNPRLFTAGSSLILFLRWDRPGEALVDFIRERKGSSRIGERGQEHLRSLSPLTDRGFSLVHSPDDLDGVRHEIGLVLGERGVAEFLDPRRTEARKEEVVSILPFVPLTADPHPFDILPRVVAQVAATCVCAPMNRGIAEPASRLFDQAQLCRRSLSTHTVDKAFERELWSHMAALQHGVGELIAAQREQVDWALSPIDLRRALRTAELLTTVASACVEERFTVMECEAMIEALHACHLPPSEWDEHRLRLVAAYHRRPAAVTHA